jgi:hypothetical protein
LEAFSDLRERTINNCDALKIISGENDMEADKVTSHIMQMNVIRDGPGRFVKYTIEFISEDARIRLEKKLRKLI